MIEDKPGVPALWDEGQFNRHDTGPFSALPPRTLDDERLFSFLSPFAVEGVFAFVLFGASLFIVQLATLGAAAFVAVTILYIWYRPGALGSALRDRWPILLFPAFTLASVFWSDSAAFTLKHSLEYLITIVAALLVSSSKNPRSVALGIFLAFALYSILSLVAGSIVNVGVNGTTALSGLDDSKNEQADAVGTGLLVSAFLLCLGWKARSGVQVVLALAVAAVQTYCLAAARSTGAIAGVSVGLVAFALLVSARSAGRRTRIALVGSVGATMLAIGTLLLLFSDQILELLAVSFGKDVTLTGRTYLWARASELVMDRPFLGRGFDAFWQQGNLDAEGIWRYAHVVSREGFNFHNTAYDVLVALGWAGLLLFGVAIVSGVAGAALHYVRRPSMFSCFWLSIALYILIRTPVETLGIYAFAFPTLMLFALLGSGLGQTQINLAEESSARVLGERGGSAVAGQVAL